MTLVTCTACERHIRRAEKHCPFCGVAVAPDVAAGSQSVITDQVTNGVAVRMALLYLLAGTHAPDAV